VSEREMYGQKPSCLQFSCSTVGPTDTTNQEAIEAGGENRLVHEQRCRFHFYGDILFI
jgi:hypothetical protein